MITTNLLQRGHGKHYVVRVLGYLAKTPDFRIEGQIHGDRDKVEVYSDSDHGGDKHVTYHAESHGEPNLLEWGPSSLAKCKIASGCSEQCRGRNICVIRSSEMWAPITMEM